MAQASDLAVAVAGIPRAVFRWFRLQRVLRVVSPVEVSWVRKNFCGQIGIPMQRGKLPVRTWLAAVYVITSSHKGLSSVQLRKQLGVTQLATCFINH